MPLLTLRPWRIDGESPKVAAQRETWEETGLVVTVGEELGRTDTVTSLAIDHVDWLGDDINVIGFEKAGIYRPGKPAICVRNGKLIKH